MNRICIYLMLLLATISTSAQVSNVGSPYMDVQGPLYLRGNLHILNKNENNWLIWGTRNTSGSESAIDLTNIGYIDMVGLNKRLYMGGVPGSTFGIAYNSTYPDFGIFYTEGTTDYVSLSPNGNSKNGVLNVFGDGKVGIGTTTPLFDLSTSNSGVIATSTLRLQNSYLDNKGWFGVQLCGIDNGTDGHDLYIQGRTTSTGSFANLMRVKNNGNIGFNTTDIESWHSSYGAFEFPYDAIMYRKDAPSTYYISNAYWDGAWKYKSSNPASMYANYGGSHFFSVVSSGVENNTISWTNVMAINNDGNVGIGTTTPGEFMLAVAGKIHATEIQVDALPWPDFVFTPTYNLRTLSEVENFITQNQHLPDVPSQAQVAAEGISLGEMNAILLQKIEELTLYTIEQEKDLKEQKAKIVKVETQNSELKTQVENNKKLEDRINKLEVIINQMNK